MTKSYYQKIVEKEHQTQTQTEYFDRFKDKPFWIPGDEEAHAKEYDRTKGMCCGWHIIGCPSKEGRGRLPCFDYEWDLYQAIEEKKYVWVKKSAGLGISTFMMYYIIYKSITSQLWQGKSVVLLTGPNIDVATSLIKRLKALFPPNVLPETEKHVCVIGSTHVQAYPSFNLPSARGLEAPILAWLDEADYFSVGLQDEALVTAERYIGKSPGLAIVLTSTPAAPEGLYWNIEKLPTDQCQYHRMVMDYTVGLGKIYTEAEIAAARASSSFPREYLCEYLGIAGNIFTESKIQTMIQQGRELEQLRGGPDLIPQANPKAIGVDPGFSSSRFAIVVSQLAQKPAPSPGNNGGGIGSRSVVEVIHAEEFENANFGEMITEIVSIYRNFQNVANIYIDGSSAVTITPLKQALGELRYNGDYHEELRRLKGKRRNPAQYMKVLPVSFREESREMLAHTKRLLDAEVLAISPTLNKLIVSMRTAYGVEGTLKKKSGDYDDSLDALMLSLKHFELPTPTSTSVQVLTPPASQPFVIPLGGGGSRKPYY